MSFTLNFDVFGGVTEDGINNLLSAILTARPHYINYGSAAFVPANSFSATNMPPISFPGVAGGIQWAASFTIPELTLFNDPRPTPLPPLLNGFTVQTQVTLQIASGSVTLDVFAQGSITSQYSSPGNGSMSFEIDEILVGFGNPAAPTLLLPPGLEAVLDDLLKILLNAALASLSIPLATFSLGLFNLTLENGPLIDLDAPETVAVRGTVS